MAVFNQTVKYGHFHEHISVDMLLYKAYNSSLNKKTEYTMRIHRKMSENQELLMMFVIILTSTLAIFEFGFRMMGM